MIRATLISLIYKSSLDFPVGTVEASSPISLMGADIDRIVTKLRWVISTAPNIIQVGIALWILETRLGPICVAPVPVVLGEFESTTHFLSRYSKLMMVMIHTSFGIRI
jgi:hypothetical protein